MSTALPTRAKHGRRSRAQTVFPAIAFAVSLLKMAVCMPEHLLAETSASLPIMDCIGRLLRKGRIRSRRWPRIALSYMLGPATVQFCALPTTAVIGLRQHAHRIR